MPRVLCVDDDSNLLEGLQRHLRRHCEVRIAVGAENALKLMAQEEPFSVVVSDLRMPGMDGITFLREVAQRMPDAAGVLLTGNADLNAAITSVNEGHVFRFLTKPCPPPVLISVVLDAHQHGQRRKLQQQLILDASERDMLTGLADRRRFIIDVDKHRSLAPQACLLVLVVSIDDIPVVRQTLGHAAADQLMVTCAQRMGTLNDTSVYRLGDQLALLRTDHAPLLHLFAEQTLKRASSEMTLGTQVIRPSIRIGATTLNTLYYDAEAALRDAQSACAAAEPIEGRRIRVYSADVVARDARRMQLVQALRSPRLFEELSCVYQPQWNLPDYTLAGIEVLLRWNNPRLGAVSPAEFMPIAEQEGLSERIGDWVLQEGCRQRLAWCGLVPDHVRIAVNLSAREFDDVRLLKRIQNRLAELRFRPTWLELEITESIAMADLHASVTTLRHLRELGISVAIDDFGIGYSSLSYLAHLPTDALKLDRTFLLNLQSMPNMVNLVRGVAQLGHAMGMRVLAEGVESLAQLRLLATLGCDAAQGYAIAVPAAAEAFTQWLREESGPLAQSLRSDN